MVSVLPAHGYGKRLVDEGDVVLPGSSVPLMCCLRCMCTFRLSLLVLMQVCKGRLIFSPTENGKNRFREGCLCDHVACTPVSEAGLEIGLVPRSVS